MSETNNFVLFLSFLFLFKSTTNYKGRSENIRTFCSFSKTVKHFFQPFYSLYSSAKFSHLRMYTFAIFVGAFVSPLQAMK